MNDSAQATLDWNIPASRVSNIIFLAGSSAWASGCCNFGPRGVHLSFTNNCLQLPSNLNYEDDLDYAVGGWEQ